MTNKTIATTGDMIKDIINIMGASTTPSGKTRTPNGTAMITACDTINEIITATKEGNVAVIKNIGNTLNHWTAKITNHGKHKGNKVSQSDLSEFTECFISTTIKHKEDTYTMITLSATSASAFSINEESLENARMTILSIAEDKVTEKFSRMINQEEEEETQTVPEPIILATEEEEEYELTEWEEEANQYDFEQELAEELEFRIENETPEEADERMIELAQKEEGNQEEEENDEEIWFDKEETQEEHSERLFHEQYGYDAEYSNDLD